MRIVSAIQLNVFRVRGVELIARYPPSALAASVRKHGRRERRYLASAIPPREMQVECNVQMKKSYRARARIPSDLSPWSRDLPRCVHSLAQTCFLMARPLLETRKSEISILERALSALYVVFALQRPFSFCVMVNKGLNVTDHPSDQSWDLSTKLRNYRRFINS